MKNKLYATASLGEGRRAKGWTQQQFADILAARVGKPVSLSVVQKWEIGNRAISPDMVVELSSCLNVSVTELVERK